MLLFAVALAFNVTAAVGIAIAVGLLLGAIRGAIHGAAFVGIAAGCYTWCDM